MFTQKTFCYIIFILNYSKLSLKTAFNSSFIKLQNFKTFYLHKISNIFLYFTFEKRRDLQPKEKPGVFLLVFF